MYTVYTYKYMVPAHPKHTAPHPRTSRSCGSNGCHCGATATSLRHGLHVQLHAVHAIPVMCVCMCLYVCDVCVCVRVCVCV
jgi:hypothetical protein